MIGSTFYDILRCILRYWDNKAVDETQYFSSIFSLFKPFSLIATCAILKLFSLEYQWNLGCPLFLFVSISA